MIMKNKNTENKNSLIERQGVTCSEGEAVTELSQPSGSKLPNLKNRDFR